MKIISKYSDYYDYVSYIYGVDNNVVYERDRISDEKHSFCHVFRSTNRTELGCGICFKDDGPIRYHNEWLVVNGRPYPIISLYKKSKFYQPGFDNFSFLHNEIYNKDKHSKYFNKIKPNSFNDVELTETDKEYGWLVQLSKEIQAPIFIIENIKSRFKNNGFDNFITISSDYPRLKDFKGFASYYTPEQMYQNLSNFLTNVMNDSPDSIPDPQIPLTDIDKIKAHGFDTKTSFRKSKSNV